MKPTRGMHGPRIAVSMGDPAGISPDIIADTLCREAPAHPIVVMGHWPTLLAAFERLGKGDSLALVAPPAIADPGHIAVWHCGTGDDPIDNPGERGARAQLDALSLAVDAMVDKQFDALVTAPVSKVAIAGLMPDFVGHTEYLARRCGLKADDVTMVFASETLYVGLVSTHLSMRDVSDAFTSKRLERTFCHLFELARRFHPDRTPRIGVAALNPHAGEAGLFGSEEKSIIEPFCREMAERFGADVTGPLPADAIYRDALAGAFDAVVAAYHDQAMIPLKLAGVGQMVNLTMGLPFIRTSPDHGVAYELARTGRADASGFRFALRLAVALAPKPSAV